MSLPDFDHAAVGSLEEAATLLDREPGLTAVIAGGTDLLGILKERVHADHPKLVVDIKACAEGPHITFSDTSLRIGSLTTLAELAEDELVNAKVPLLAQAARAVASPQIRNMATVGGNLCQEPRCWYYRAPNDSFHCLRKGGAQCAALLGDHRYHSIFGAVRPCAPPCSADCPAHIDIPAYLELIRAGDWQGAARVVLERNPMPAVTGRVCPHFCEAHCNRCELDEGVSTRAIERHLGDLVLNDISRFFEPPHEVTDKRVAVVGSGPAGLAAAYYLRRAGHHVTVFDAMGEPGGMLSHSIPRYRLPRAVVEKQVEALKHLGVEFVLGSTVDKDTLSGLAADFDSTFVATGAWRDKSLGIEGAEYLRSGLEFLKTAPLLGRSPGDEVLVIGGGGVAVDVAVSARRLGAKRVVMACLESREIMPALPEEIAEALSEGVELLTSFGPQRVLTTEQRLSGMELVRCTSVFDAEGRFRPSFDSDTTLKVEADCVLLAIGQEPDLDFADGLLETDGSRIQVTESAATSLPGVFAGGDAVTGPAFVIEAVAAGRRAAIAIDGYLGASGARTAVAGNGGTSEPSPLIKVRPEALASIPRVQTSALSRGIETEDADTLEALAVEAEAERCLDCACIAVNVSDLAPALVALGARIRTTKRVIDAEGFFAVKRASATVLDPDELVVEVEIPLPAQESIQRYRKFRIRHSIDFAIVSVASLLTLRNDTIEQAAVVLGAVAPVPMRAAEVERFLVGRPPDAETAEAAGALALRTACPMPRNAFKAQIVRALVREAVLELR